MIIRSQNKRHLVNMGVLSSISITADSVFAHTDDRTVCLGEYENTAVAIKVLDMICNAYERHSLFSITYQDGMVSKLERCNGLNETRDLISPIFQMPSDEEVEV